MKMRMYSKLPRFVYLKREKYFINTDYRIFIKFEKGIQDKDNKGIIYDTLRNFYPDFFEIIDKGLLKEASDKFIWFYRCGKTDDEIEYDKYNGKGSSNDRIYDYEYDADMIYSTFYDRGIDLSKDYVHWWKFRALFKSMPDNCEFKKIMSYRSYEGKDKDMLELKNIYKLPPTKFQVSERKRQDKIFEELNKIASQK